MKKCKIKSGVMHRCVIHIKPFLSAGVLRDALIVKKQQEDIAAVLAPKIQGTVNVDDVLQEEHLDFVVMFSSTSSVFGNIGQCDYAYANGFMDAYAAYREKQRAEGKRHGKSIAINWPLWAEGGMQIDNAAKKLMKHLLGAEPLTNEDGIQIFLAALLQDTQQFIVLAGQKSKLTKLFEQVSIKKVAPSSVTLRTDDSLLLEKVQVQLTQTASELLKINLTDLDVDTLLSEYGADSIFLMNFANQTNIYYAIKITAAALFECRTIKNFADYLVNEHRDAVEARHQEGTESQFTQVIPKNEKRGTPTYLKHDSVKEKSPNQDQAIASKESQNKQTIKKASEEAALKEDLELSALTKNPLKLLLISDPGYPDIEVAIIGKGPPVLILGGILQSYQAWKYQFGAFSDQYQLIIINPPGCGRSEMIPKKFNLNAMKQNIGRVLESLNIKSLPIIGFSLGGMIALDFCLTSPECVSALIIADASADTTSEDFRNVAHFKDITEETNPLKKLNIMTNHFIEETNTNPLENLNLMTLNVNALPLYIEAVFNFNILDKLKNITVPTLVITGEKDGIVTPECALDIKQRIPDASFAIIPNAGHAAPFTHYDEFNALVRHFLKKVRKKSKIE